MPPRFPASSGQWVSINTQSNGEAFPAELWPCSEQGQELMSRCSASCSLVPLCGLALCRMAFLTMCWQQPLTRACAKVIQILPEFWAPIQTRPEFLRATLSPAMH